MFDTKKALLAVALLAAIGAAGCHHTTTGDAGPADANRPVSDTGTNHFDPCVNDTDCPVGDLCSFADAIPPSRDSTAPLQCRPPCTGDEDCVVPLREITIYAACASDHYCVGWCSSAGGVIPPCESPTMCHVFPGLEQGYCYRPAPSP